MDALWRQLAAAPAGTVAALAASLGWTPQAVIEGLEALTTAGVPVWTQAGLYGCQPAPQPLAVAAADLHGCCERVVLCDTLGSTQDHALAQLRDEPALRSVLVTAEQQSAGRGRSGRAWMSPLGAHLTFSLGLRLPPGIGTAALVGLPVRLGLAVARTLAAHGVPARLKWPNDLWLAGRKLGGLLVELHPGTGADTLLIIGLGLNHRMPAHQPWPDQPWIDLAATGLLPASRAAWLQRLVPALAEVARQTADPAAPSGWTADYAAYDALAGHSVRAQHGNDWITGAAAGIAADGRLRIHGTDRVHLLSAGEVHMVRPGQREVPWRLLLDCGNTRLKWAWSTGDGALVLPGPSVQLRDAGGQLRPLLRITSDLTAAIAALCVQEPPSSIALCSSFGGDRGALEQALSTLFGVPVQQPATPATLGRWRSAYPQPALLGYDRALAMRAVLPLLAEVERALLVSVGSALTLDVLGADGRHEGGLIGVAPTLGASALHALSPRLDPAGAGYAALAIRSNDAVFSATLQAAAGLVERIARQQRVQRVLLTGGGAGPLQAILDVALPVHTLDHLVLWGLAASNASTL